MHRRVIQHTIWRKVGYISHGPFLVVKVVLKRLFSLGQNSANTAHMQTQQLTTLTGHSARLGGGLVRRVAFSAGGIQIGI